MTYKEALERVKEYDSKLQADDGRFRSCVRLILDDGSIFMWNRAFIMTIANTDYLAVFTEHHMFHIYDQDDITECRVYKEAYDSAEVLE